VIYGPYLDPEHPELHLMEQLLGVQPRAVPELEHLEESSK